MTLLAERPATTEPAAPGSYVTVAGAPAVAGGTVEGSYVTLSKAA